MPSLGNDKGHAHLCPGLRTVAAHQRRLCQYSTAMREAFFCSVAIAAAPSIGTQNPPTHINYRLQYNCSL
uniref:Uncharacterized protein n=1 Tax=Ralstonia solanacearum TaxID=305 RepID=A0A0S4W3E8_RALSL|nr:protein of unknown function [Ralstonia solanacearum]